MSEFRELVDVDAMLVTYLKNAPELAELGRDRISTDLPTTWGLQADDKSRVQIYRSGGGRISPWIERPLIDLRVYGSTWQDAFELIAKVDLALQAIVKRPLSRGIVSEVQLLTGPVYRKDEDTDIPRYLSSYAMVTHSR